MKRRTLLIGWAMLPLPACWYHARYGAVLAAHDRAAGLISSTAAHVRANDWPAAEADEVQLLNVLPDDEPHRDDRIRVHTAIQVARSHQKRSIEAIADLTALLHSTSLNHAASDVVCRDVRNQLAQLYYYTGWQMRLEGSPRWTRQVERAREQFHYLAMTEPSSTDHTANLHNLEAAIRLARMDLTELRATPLPPPAQGMESQPATEQSQQDDDQHGGGAGTAPPDTPPDERNRGTGGNSGGKFGRPLTGS